MDINDDKIIIDDFMSRDCEFSPIKFLLRNNINDETIHSYIVDTKALSLDKMKQIISKFILLHHLIDFTSSEIFYLSECKNSIWRFIKRDNKNIGSIRISYLDSFNFNDFKKKIEPKIKRRHQRGNAKFSLLTLSNGNWDTVEKTLKNRIIIDKKNNYNINCSLDNIIKDVSSDKSGLILFSGIPGTGKSTLIKYLAQEIRKKHFHIISNNNFGILCDPQFTNFLVENMNDIIIVIEDAEEILQKRGANNKSISDILNLTDGIIGDLINIKIIATINVIEHIDEALLRKGRLIRKVEFSKLTKEQVVEVSRFIGNEINNPQEMTISEIYNRDDNGVNPIITNKIGFNLN